MDPSAVSNLFVKLPSFVVALFFMQLPSYIEYYSSVQETADAVQATGKQEYVHNVEEIFDYVIIGAGSAGAVVANRLSADGINKVLILEAGGDPNPFTTVPALFTRVNQPSTDYGYSTERQLYACLAPNAETTSCQYARGRGLGGTSNLNAMNYLRGNPNDYDEWYKVTQDFSWSYQSVLKFFKKSEDYHGAYPLKAHGAGGELYVGEQGTTKLLEFFFQAARQMKLENYDMNNFQQEGYANVDQTIKDGKRWGTYNAFLRPILNRENLYIYRYARALKIHFDKSDSLRAYGVKYIRHGIERFVRARKEVIVSAGSVDSPRILMLSGIGPKDHLHSIGVNPLIDLPVGKHLEDHILVNIAISFNRSNLAYIPERDMTYNDIVKYSGFGTGPPARTFFNPAGVIFISSSEGTRFWPDIEILAGGNFNTLPDGTFQEVFGFNIILKRPKSNGEIRLGSSNPFDRPVIHPNYLTHPSDIKRFLEGIQFVLAMLETPAYRSIGATLAPNTPVAACANLEFKSWQYWECFVRQMTTTLCNPTGTCRMGKDATDSNAVVDSKLRVLYTKGLRVIDSSVMPFIPTGHTNAPSIAIGEIGASFILQDSFS